MHGKSTSPSPESHTNQSNPTHILAHAHPTHCTHQSTDWSTGGSITPPPQQQPRYVPTYTHPFHHMYLFTHKNPQPPNPPTHPPKCISHCPAIIFPPSIDLSINDPLTKATSPASAEPPAAVAALEPRNLNETRRKKGSAQTRQTIMCDRIECRLIPNLERVGSMANAFIPPTAHTHTYPTPISPPFVPSSFHTHACTHAPSTPLTSSPPVLAPSTAAR